MEFRSGLRATYCLLFSRHHFQSSLSGEHGSAFAGVKPRNASRTLCTAIALMALPLAAARLGAQQGVYAQQSPSSQEPLDNGYGGRYARSQQYGDQQPQYTQQPQYAQQPYTPPQAAQPQYAAPQDYPQDNYAQQANVDPTENVSQPGYQPGEALGERALNAQQLEQIVAPIALYPDSLVAQVLAASTYPAEVAAADQWVRSQQGASPQQIAAGANAQSAWDPSVKALTAFPQVLAEMDRNLQWTADLGNAYYNQPQDVMQTIQVMRDRAQAAGNLQSTPQEQVTVDQGNIELAPPSPQVVYVPTYNPWGVYGQPLAPYPGFTLLDAIGATVESLIGPPIQFGLGIAMTAFNEMPFGLIGWGLDWFAHDVLFDHGAYCSRSSEVHDWGFAHGGPRAFGGRGELARTGFNRYGDNGRSNGAGYPRPRPEMGRNQGQAFGRQSGNGRTGHQSLNRGYAQGNNFGRSGPYQQAYNRMPQAIGRPQQYGGSQAFASHPPAYAGGNRQFGRQGYGSNYGAAAGSNYSNRQYGSYGARSGMTNGGTAEIYRSPGLNYGGSFNQRQSNGFGNSYRAQNNSSGFHLFGHSGGSPNSGGNRGSGGYSFSGRSSGGFGGMKAPKADHFGGSGNHFGGGGGGHFGGGRSSGGHSSGGGHSGGGHDKHR